MAAELVWDELPDSNTTRLRILDPMAGSGTTLIAARLRGHEAIGYDSDPLAVLISRAWLTNVKAERAEAKASELLLRARSRARDLPLSKAYPRKADEETKAFVRYWFDNTNRIQLAALSDSISRVHDRLLRDLMWCAFSRLIITKQSGVSLAIDISHSRPHRGYDTAPILVFDYFERAVKQVMQAAVFSADQTKRPPAYVNLADARELPMRDNSVDIVITSPPYLNAIDYVRGHKFSLIWMGHSIGNLRDLRATNVGTELAGNLSTEDGDVDHILGLMCPIDKLSNRHAGMLRHYIRDMRTVLSETRRVLRKSGRAIFVVGNCNIRNTFVQNSKCIIGLAKELGLVVSKTRSRLLPENRRYLPPPESVGVGKALRKRMRQEVVITLLKN